MDPNETLRQIRAHVKQIHADEDPAIVRQRSLDLAELVESLDGWIVGGGFLPNAWRKGIPEGHIR